MKIIPAIDILNGECVRLYQGNYDQATWYEKDPVHVAREFIEAGAKRLHIVDLNAAKEGWGRNRKVIRKIRKAVDCTLEFGGGIRDDETIEELLNIGVNRLVVGTMLAKSTDRVAGWVQHYGPIFIGGIDAQDGHVKISGWEHTTKVKDTELAEKAREIGMCGIIYTAIDRDGTLQGPDIEKTNIIAETSELPVTLSGGISKEEDIKQVIEKSHQNVKGIITGKAIYDKRIDLAKIISQYQTDDKEVTW